MKQRVITGVIIAAIFLSLLQWGGYGFALLIMALAIIGFYEFLRINGLRAADPVSLLGFAGVICIVFPWYEFKDIPHPSMQAMIWVLLFLLLFATVWTKNKVNLATVSIIITGVIYIGLGFYFMTYTRLENGLFWSYLLFICIWLTDIGAYFTGWAIGKHKLWPAISPNKTVEGAIGGIVFSIGAAIVFSILAPEQLPLYKALYLGLLISIVGQMGDLIQSAYKRVYGVKDSGSIFPGHGGVLDRTDSWLIVFPFIHLLSLI